MMMQREQILSKSNSQRLNWTKYEAILSLGLNHDWIRNHYYYFSSPWKGEIVIIGRPSNLKTGFLLVFPHDKSKSN